MRERSELAELLVAARTAVSDLELEQAKAEADLGPVRERLSRNQRRIADGSIADPKVLSGLIDEVAHLTRRIGDLEDAELDVMQRLEDASTTEARLTERTGSLGQQGSAVTVRRDQQVAAIEAEAAAAAAERTVVAAEVPDALLALYDKIRAGHGGIGAAALKQRRCTGCQLELNASDLRVYAVAPGDEVLRCEECSRILIRTADSGL